MATPKKPKSTLRPVAEDERAPKRRKKLSVSEAAASGDQIALLEAMRDRVAQAITAPDCPPRDLGTLTKRLGDITEQLRALTLAEAEEALDGVVTPDEAWDEKAL